MSPQRSYDEWLKRPKKYGDFRDDFPDFVYLDFEQSIRETFQFLEQNGFTLVSITRNRAIYQSDLADITIAHICWCDCSTDGFYEEHTASARHYDWDHLLFAYVTSPSDRGLTAPEDYSAPSPFHSNHQAVSKDTMRIATRELAESIRAASADTPQQCAQISQKPADRG